MKVYEDNESCIKIVKHGYSPALRYLDKTQRVDIGWLHEVFHRDELAELHPEPTEAMKADIFTKAIAPCHWQHALQLIGVHIVKG